LSSVHSFNSSSKRLAKHFTPCYEGPGIGCNV
jgi:hypothetical protein